MLFKRRNPQPLWDKLYNLLWPKMGWKRVWKYYKHRTVRIDDSSHSIAAGLAVGCAISFTPAFGTHLIQCIFICWLIRGNWIASWIGTAFGNPWTFPFLLWISYQVGTFLFRMLGLEGFYISMPQPLELSDMMDAPLKILFPMLVGGYICGIITFPLFYYPFRTSIRGARAARRLRMQKKAHKVAKEVTGQEK